MTTSGNARAAERWNHALMANFATPQLELVRGHGAVVTDADGNEYLDLLGGIAVNALGYTHPAIVEAVTAQVSTLAHVSNYFSDPPVLALAERLQELAGAGDEGRVAFVNSGTEANEVAFKMARLTGRPRIIATEGGFHGRTMGSLAMTGQPGKKEPFEPMPPGVEFIPFGDADALQSAVHADPHTVAAFIVEPIQGEAGVRVPPDGYLAAARRITREAGALLILDEVQTGIGRTGTWFAHQQAGITPDVMTLAKGLGGGLPLGAVIGYGAAARLLTPGSHGTTFGGNPVCAAAALAVLDVIESSELLAHVDGLGKHVIDAIEGLSHPLVAEVRGRGLLIGMQLHEPVAAAATAAALRAGFLINAAAGDVLRLAPPLIVSQEQADSFVAALPTILDAATATDKEH